MIQSLLAETRLNLLQAMRGYKLFIGLAGILSSFAFAMLEYGNSKGSVIFIYQYIIDGIPFFLCMAFCAIPFADSLREEIENNYYRVALVRQKLSTYVLSKLLAVYLTGIFVMAMGTICFTFVLRLTHPWVMVNDSLYDYATRKGAFRTILTNGNYVLYFVLCGILLGLLGGCLALAATMLSLFVKSSLLIYSIPALLYYLTVYLNQRLTRDFNLINLYKIFSPSYNIWNNDLKSFLWSCFISLMIAAALGTLITLKVERILRNE